MWRFDPQSYKVGDPIYVSYHHGWNTRRATLYHVKRITPKGQITASNGNREIRLTARGDVIGQTGYRRDSVVSEEAAIEFAREQRADDWWNVIRDAAMKLERAARSKDSAALTATFAKLATVIAARPCDGTPETLTNEAEHPAPATASVATPSIDAADIEGQ